MKHKIEHALTVDLSVVPMGNKENSINNNRKLMDQTETIIIVI